MLKTVSFGTYIEGESLLHRLQARTKLLALVGIAIWLMIANQNELHYAPEIAAILLLSTGIALSRIPLRQFWQRMWLLVLFTVIGSVPTLFTPETDKKPLYPIGPFTTTYGMAQHILLIAIIVLGAILLTSFLPVPILRMLWRNMWLRRLRMTLILLFVVALVWFWYIYPNTATQVYNFGPYPITHLGVWLVTGPFIALLLIFAFSLLVTMSTTPVTLIEGLTMLMAPLRYLRLPVDDFALMALLALRFIPTLTEEVEQLVKAQTARGGELVDGSIRERIQSLAMLFVPLVQSILRRASELATALEARGYQVDGKQTRLYENRFGVADYVVMGGLLVVIVGTLVM